MLSLMRVKPLAKPLVLLSGIFKVLTKFGSSELICIPKVKLAKDLSLDLFGKLFFLWPIFGLFCFVLSNRCIHFLHQRCHTSSQIIRDFWSVRHWKIDVCGQPMLNVWTFTDRAALNLTSLTWPRKWQTRNFAVSIRSTEEISQTLDIVAINHRRRLSQVVYLVTWFFKAEAVLRLHKVLISVLRTVELGKSI